MDTHPDAEKPEPPPRRPNPLAEEIATYRAKLVELLPFEGSYVLIKGKEVIGIYPDDRTALREGYDRFGNVHFLVHQIQRHERVIYMPNVEL